MIVRQGIMTHAAPFAFLASISALALSACAGASEKYPSLAIRDAERAVGQFSPAPPEPTAPTYVVDRTSIGDALDRARQSHERFLARRPDAADLAQAAAGRGNESDIRARALVALADLTSMRGETAIALADLDRLEVEAATVFAPAGEVAEAQSYVARLVGEQDQALDAIAREMGL
jgi:hypothetical protein